MQNKKLLREYAAPGWTIPSGHGLLHAAQVSYIVRTAVRIIDHHKTLILYIYDREQALQGVSGPRWTMFQNRTEYITLDRDGSRTKWRSASFEHLNNDYFFPNKCAFYSQQDEARVSDYFHSEYGGAAALVRAQSAILSKRQQERQRQRDREVLERMEPVKALPRGLKSWVRRSVMPAYFFYDYKRKQKSVAGTCSACGKQLTLSNVKHNAKAVCPHCGRELTIKSRGRCGYIYDQGTCQVVQKASGSELVIRIIKAHYDYSGDEPKANIYENARIFVRLDDSGKVCCDNYYYSFGRYELTHWKQGIRPVFYPYQYNFEPDTCGYVYTKNLPKALIGTPWQYCPIALFFEHYHKPRELIPFLNAYMEHPRFEHLIKVGFFELAACLAYHEYDTVTLDETQNRTHRILKVAPEDVDFLRNLQVGLSTLRAFQKHSRENLKGRQDLFRWTEANNVAYNVDKILQNLTVHKFLNYMDKQYDFLQFRKTSSGGTRYDDMQSLVNEYRDYLEMCGKEKYDLHNDFILFPKDLQKAHDAVAGRIKHKADAKARRKFKAIYARIGNTLDFERDGMKIVCPATPDDIIAEGQALHHCVGGYVNRVARGECVILFLRRCDNLDKPFYTIELRNQEVVQLKGMGNADATPEVQAFVDWWVLRVLRAKKAAA